MGDEEEPGGAVMYEVEGWGELTAREICLNGKFYMHEAKICGSCRDMRCMNAR